MLEILLYKMSFKIEGFTYFATTIVLMLLNYCFDVTGERNLVNV